MIRSTVLFLSLFSLLISGGQTFTSEFRLHELVKMKSEAEKLYKSFQNKKGKEYLDGYDKYVDLINNRIITAKKYLYEFSTEKQSKESLTNLLEIAKIAKDEKQIIDILKILFNKYPKTKKDNKLLKLYFRYAYLLEPIEAEKYLETDKVPPEYELYMNYMLALGFAETGNLEKSEIYKNNADGVFSRFVENIDPQKEYRLITDMIELQSWIAIKMGKRKEAEKNIQEAKKQYSDKSIQTKISKIEKRIGILGNTALSLETQHWIGKKDFLDLSELKGKVILLDFLAWSCGACNSSIPSLLALQKQIKDDNFVIIGATKYVGSYEYEKNISEEREYELMRDHYFKKRKINWPISMSKTSMENYGISGTPTYLLIDKNGIVRDGYFISNFSFLEKKVKSLLKES